MNKFKGALIAAASAAIVLGGTATYQVVGDTASTPSKEYTVMIYMIGSDLADAASTDLMEIQQTLADNKLDDNVNVVAEIGGTKEKWNIPELKDVTNAIISVSEDGISVNETQGDINLGESETLTNFIDYAYDNYPAENYMLIFWDHGNGPAQGFGDDVLHNDDSLLLDELDSGLEEAKIKEFDLIGFDACCMGNVETLNTVSDYCDYMVASPASEDVAGWNYSWLKILKADSDTEIDFEDIGSKIVESYTDYFEEQGTYNNKYVTLSCYDTGVYKESVYDLISEINEEYLSKVDEAWMDSFNNNRNNLVGYFSGNMFGEPLDLVDLYQFYACVLKSDEVLSQLESELAEMICSTNLKTEDGFYGIAIYLPNDQDTHYATEIYNYRKCGYESTYLDFVLRYSKHMNLTLEIDFEIIDAAVDNKSKEIKFSLSEEAEEDIAQIYVATVTEFNNADGQYLVATDSDVTLDGVNAVANLDQQYFSIDGEILCSIESLNTEDMTQYQCPVIYNDELCIMIVEVSAKNTDPEIKSIIPFTGDRQSEKVQYTLAPGDKIKAVYPQIDLESQTEEFTLTEILESGSYQEGEYIEINQENCELGWTGLNFSTCEFYLEIVDSHMNVHWKSSKEE
jgi:hypothetical protein